jgi:hypothetical protein
VRRALLVASLTAVVLAIASPAALATTQTAQGGDVTATFTFTGRSPQIHGQHLRIARAGAVVYDQPVVSSFCGSTCDPFALSRGKLSVAVVDLEPGGEPDVVLDLYTGGAHCCVVVQVFSFDPGSNTYVMTERNFGDAGDELVDLGHNGQWEFLSADDSFAYAFTDFAASGLPIQILTFSARHFTDVTRAYPALIAKDAATWMKAFEGLAKQHYQDSVGVVAAWAADEELLGHGRRVNRFLARQLKLGHLNSALSPQEPGGARFVAILRRFLRRHGYLR